MSNERKARITYSLDEATILENTSQKGDGKILFDFARTFNRLLEEKGIDQERIAADLQISEGAVSNYRKGITAPKLPVIVKMANYLGVDCQYLMTGIRSEHQTLEQLGFSAEAIKFISELHRNNDGGDGPCLKTLNDLLEIKSINAFLRASEECFYTQPLVNYFSGLQEFLYSENMGSDEMNYYQGMSETLAHAMRSTCIFALQKAAADVAEELLQKKEFEPRN